MSQHFLIMTTTSVQVKGELTSQNWGVTTRDSWKPEKEVKKLNLLHVNMIKESIIRLIF